MRLSVDPNLTKLTSARSLRRLRSAVSVLVAVTLTLSPLSGTVALSDETTATETGTTAEQPAPSSSGSSDASSQSSPGSTGESQTSSGSTGGSTQTSADPGQTQPSGGQATNTNSGTTGAATTGSGSSAPPSAEPSGGTQPTESQPAPGTQPQPASGAEPQSGQTVVQPSNQVDFSAAASGRPNTQPTDSGQPQTGEEQPGQTTPSTPSTAATPAETSKSTEQTTTLPTAQTDGQITNMGARSTGGSAPVSSTSAPTPATTQATPGSTAQSGQTITENSSQVNSATGSSQPSTQSATNSSAGTGVQNTASSASPTVGTSAQTPQATPTSATAVGTLTPALQAATNTLPIPIAVTPVPSNEPAVAAQSGDAAAQTGQSQSAQINMQVSTGVTGGGGGPVSVKNDASTTIDRTGSASAESGMAIALTPAAQPTGTLSAGQTADRTTAASGDATAIGLQSQSVVNNTSVASVQVQGPSSGSIKVASINRVVITEGAQASASSGDAMAAPEGTPRPVAAPTALQSTTGIVAGATSSPVATIGLQARNDVNLQMEVTATPQPGASGTLTVRQAGQVTLENRGAAQAVSDGACAGAGCPTVTKVEPLGSPTPVPLATNSSATATGSPGQTPTTPPSNDSSASSGSAEATGLVAQNVVNTDANVQVTVKGENRGLIQVLIESITQIFNFGRAAATTGDAVAADSGASTSGASTAPASTAAEASSGDAQATGAKVDNRVDVHSSASVQVAGDNYNPINLFVDIFARITNFAFGWARSGDAQATGDPSASGNGATASSGSASATGLEVQNLVNMSANAAVNIEGSNYADIFLRVRFHTIIENEGGAKAVSGDAKSIGHSGALAVPSSGGSSGQAQSDGSGAQGLGNSELQSSVAKSGAATAYGHNSSLQLASAQYANANGSGPGMNVALPPVSNSLPDPPTLPESSLSSLPEGLQPWIDMVGDVHAESGNASSQGFTTGDAVTNIQVAHAANPGRGDASATNSYEFSMAISGNSSAQTGFAGVNATPTPVPTPRQGSDGGSDSRSVYHQLSAQLIVVQSQIAANDRPFQSTVRVSLPARWPGFEQPPMPSQRWLLEPSVPSSSGRRTGFSANAWGRAPGVYVDINPLAVWPTLELPPIPGQLAKLLMEDQAAEGPTFGYPNSGTQGPIRSLLWSLTGMLLLAAIASRKGRAWAASLAQSCLQQAQAATRLILGLLLH